jgi:hypothetical protein
LVRSSAERSLVLVVGPSGCGKPSLVRAGLVPVIADEPDWWTVRPFTPGVDPVGALARELAGSQWTLDEARDRLTGGDLNAVADEVLFTAPGRRRRLLLVVDQFEELLTQTPPERCARFVELLRSALGGPVRIVATLRPEFFDQLLLAPAFAALPTRPFPVRPLRRDALGTVIAGPARLAGIGIDDELVRRMIDDTGSGDALPLLAFTLAELANGVRRGGQLSLARYEELGGVHGALMRQADAALEDASTRGCSREQVIDSLLRLVTVDEEGRPTRWRVPHADLPDAMVDAFVTRRLLTTDTHNGEAVVEVCHEAFLTAWPPLDAAIRTEATGLRARRAVEQAAAQWARDPGRLWERGQLAAALADTKRVELSAQAQAFLQASARRDRFRRRRAVIVLSVLLVLALVGATVAVWQQNAARAQKHAAEEQQRQAVGRDLLSQAELR